MITHDPQDRTLRAGKPDTKQNTTPEPSPAHNITGPEHRTHPNTMQNTFRNQTPNKTTNTDFSLRPDDWQVHSRVVLGKSTCCYINGHHKQFILVDTIFNDILHFVLPGKCLYLSPQSTPLCTGGAGVKKAYVPDLFQRHVPGSPK